MTTNQNDVAICVNGEIYNFQQLRKELEGRYEFKSHSDSEVVLHGYVEWGIEKLLSKLDGMFAIAIVDTRKKKIYLARDRFGQKPMYYAGHGEHFLFGSEIKALFEYDDSLRVFSIEGIKDWIYHRGSNVKQTIYHGVFQLLPGCYLEVSRESIHEHVYYDVLDTMDPGSERQGDLNELSHHLDEAVRKRLMSDVPVGVQLSGGVDSSLITYFLQPHHNGGFHSFSFGFDEEYRAYSEEEYATRVADQIGSTHHQMNSNEHEVAAAFEKVIWHTDGMLMHPNTIAIYLLSLYMKPLITVSLTGEGADELLGGYTKFNFSEKVLHRGGFRPFSPEFYLSKIPHRRLNRYRRLNYLTKRYGGNSKRVLEDLNCYISRETFSQLFGNHSDSLFDGIDYERIKEYPIYRQMLILDHKTYLVSLLDRQDRASMGAAIETRVPFVDKDVVEWGMSLARNALFGDGENKRILKSLSAKIFGDEFTYRPKKGFPLPMEKWIDSQDCYKPYWDAVYDDEFLLREHMNFEFMDRYLQSDSFTNKTLNYGNDERTWIKWFLLVLRTTQDIFSIEKVA